MAKGSQSKRSQARAYPKVFFVALPDAPQAARHAHAQFEYFIVVSLDQHGNSFALQYIHSIKHWQH